jgi:hypothetical protein
MPRLALLCIWLATLRVTMAFESFIWPLLGFILLPFTTLMYVLIWSPADGSFWAWLMVGLGLLFDGGVYLISIYGARGRLFGTGP